MEGFSIAVADTGGAKEVIDRAQTEVGQRSIDGLANGDAFVAPSESIPWVLYRLSYQFGAPQLPMSILMPPEPRTGRGRSSGQ